MFGPQIVSSLEQSFTTFRKTEAPAKPAAPGSVGGGATTAFAKPGPEEKKKEEPPQEPKMDDAPAPEQAPEPSTLDLFEMEFDEFIFADTSQAQAA